MIVPVVGAGLKVAPTAGRTAQAVPIVVPIVQAVVVIGHNAALVAETVLEGETVQEGRVVADPHLRPSAHGKQGRFRQRLGPSPSHVPAVRGLS